MKKSTKIIAIVTAVTVICAAAGGSLWYLKNRDRITVDNPLIGDIADQGQTNALGLRLTDSYSYPAAVGGRTEQLFTPEGFIAETDTGWYVDGAYSTQPGERNPVLSYVDKEEHVTVAVCPRPNCTHEGSIYCTASSRAYKRGELTYADGYLYAVASKAKDPQNPEASYSQEERAVLIRIAPDGSEITELYDFGGAIDTPLPVTCHRGYLWCILPMWGGAQDTFDHSYYSRGWQIWGYELASGKATKIYESMPEEGEMNVFYNYPPQLIPDGDYLDFVIERAEQAQQKVPKNLGSGLNRININTGEAKNVLQRQITALGDGYVYYYSGGVEGSLKRQNLETGDVVECVLEALPVSNMYEPYALVDDGRYYSFVRYDVPDKKNEKGYGCAVYDLSGKLLQFVEDERFDSTTYCLRDGKLYLFQKKSTFNADTVTETVESNFYVCTVDSLLAGTPDWGEPYHNEMLQKYIWDEG